MKTLVLIASLVLAGAAQAETLDLKPVTIREWKSVFGQVEAKDAAVARTRIGGTLVELTVTEGDTVKAGQQIALVHDDKIALQIEAVDAQLSSLTAQLTRAQADYDRGKSLIDRGTITTQAFDKLKTDVEVTEGQIAAAESQRKVLEEQAAEGAVLAPADGLVLTVPATHDSVMMPGEPVATIGSGGFFLRVALPERHAPYLKKGEAIQIQTARDTKTGEIAKIYPMIEGGRVLIDVDVQGLDTAFVGARLLVRVPVGVREALVVPAAAVTTRYGIDYVTVSTDAGTEDRAVVIGEHVEEQGGRDSIEILTGLQAGDRVVVK